jgi:long-subunit fatty acid transport protein
MPELSVNLNYHMNSHWSVGIGYNFIWMNSVVTAGPQIDRVVDPTQVVPRPDFTTFSNDDYWLMGMNFSLRAEY